MAFSCQHKQTRACIASMDILDVNDVVALIPFAQWANGLVQIHQLRCAVEPYEVVYTARDAQDVVQVLRGVITFGETLGLQDLHALRRCWCVLTSSDLWRRSEEDLYVDNLFGVTNRDMTYVRYFLDQCLSGTDLYAWQDTPHSRHYHGVSFCVKNYSKIADRSLFVRLLRAYALAYPASVNARYIGARWYDKGFALHELAQCPDIEPLRTLLEAGAKTSVVDIDGRTPIYNMVQHRMDVAERIRLMYRYGLDISHIDTNLDNVFHHATRYHALAMMDALLDIRKPHLDRHGNWVGPRGRTNQVLGDPLHQINGYFNTPLYTALEDRRGQNFEMVNLLLKAGSDPDRSLPKDAPSYGRMTLTADALHTGTFDILGGDSAIDKYVLSTSVRKPDCFVYVCGTTKALQAHVCKETSNEPTRSVPVMSFRTCTRWRCSSRAPRRVPVWTSHTSYARAEFVSRRLGRRRTNPS